MYKRMRCGWGVVLFSMVPGATAQAAASGDFDGNGYVDDIYGWDWVNAVFNRAGFPEKRRARPFKSQKKGPYAEPRQLQPGDWMYYRNRSYGNIEHSGIFVGWINAPQQVALVLSYPGMQRQEPGRYRPYELTGIWSIFRPTAG